MLTVLCDTSPYGLLDGYLSTRRHIPEGNTLNTSSLMLTFFAPFKPRVTREAKVIDEKEDTFEFVSSC
jgi:hypothetical protein